MLYKKFRLCAQVVGWITIGLLAVYGLVAVLGGGDLVAWASGRAAPAADSVPPVMNYQGHLKDDSGVPLDGTYDITFRIYDNVEAPAALLWTEAHEDVTVREGYFSVLLGGSTPSTPLPDDLFVAPDRYIGVTVAPYDEMTPRQRFASVPYAFQAWQADHADDADHADNADHADDADHADRADRADRAFGLSAPDGNPANAVYVNNLGGVGIGTTAPTQKLDVNGNVRVGGNLNVSGHITGWSVTSYNQGVAWGESGDVDLKSSATSICYFDGFVFELLKSTAPDTGAACYVYIKDGMWKLHFRNLQYVGIHCRAHCVTW